MDTSAITALLARPDLTSEQRTVLTRLADLLTSLSPQKAVITEASVEAKSHRAQVMITHRDEPDMSLSIAIDRRNVVVGHPFDHEHFGEPYDDRSPLDAIDYLRRCLSGQLKVEVTHGILWRRAGTYERAGESWGLVAKSYIPFPLGRWLAREPTRSQVISFT
jgi:hypothetical protein